MTNCIFKKFLVGLCLACVTSLSCWAQVSLKEFKIPYAQSYQIKTDYSIMYDNPNQAVKLNEFKIEFFAPDNSKLGETVIESFPIDGTNEVYSLSNAILGFNSVKISIISLHDGDIANFPPSTNAILALTQDNIIPDTPENTPPSAKAFDLEIEASTNTLNRNISAYYSDPDGDTLKVTPKVINAETFSYSLSENGDLILSAPSVTGSYNIPYEVKDSGGAKTSASATINIILPENLKTDIDTHLSSINQRLSDLENKKNSIDALGPVPDGVIDRLEKLLVDNQELSEAIINPKLSNIKTDIDTLTTELKAAQGALPRLITESVETLTSQSETLKTQLNALKATTSDSGIDITNLASGLTALQNKISDLNTQDSNLPEPSLITLSNIEAWENTHILLKDKATPTGIPWLPIFIAAIGLVLLFAALQLFRKRAPATPQKQPQKEKDNHAALSFPAQLVRQTPNGFTTKTISYPQDLENYNPEKNGFDYVEPSGFIFPNNPSFETIDKNKQAEMSDLWQTAYNATGRIGLAQAGVPIGEDDCLGSCVLIANNYIITNRHVLDSHYERIMDPEELIGVEFIGELESAETEFYKISNTEIYILAERDAVILKLETTVDTARRPVVKFSSKAPKGYVEDDIMVIGYPVKPNFNDLSEAQLLVFENIEIFSVKRFSSGNVFSHQNDTDNDFIVETKTSGEYSKTQHQPALSYDASTLPGNSGGPVISKNCGDVIGLHFGDGRFPQQPANVGHSGQILRGFVSYVTSGKAINMVNKVNTQQGDYT